jgi:hypothetical protein
MKETKQTNHNSNPVSKSERNLSTGQVSTASPTSVCIHQCHSNFAVDTYVGILKYDDEPTTTQIFENYDNLCIIVLKNGKCVNQVVHDFDPLEGFSVAHFRYYDVYKLKSASGDRYKNVNTLTITLEMI